MSDLQSKPLIMAKGLMFGVILGFAVALLFLAAPSWRTAGLLALVVWAAARSYYFMFYVLERYVDPTLRYAGLLALLRELWNRSRRRRGGSR